MEHLILGYINNPKSAITNFVLAKAYDEMMHYAGACTHYLKCAEYGTVEDNELIYESLIHISLLLNKLGDRTYTEEGYLMHAISFCPDRPEAYWLLSLLYERQKKWYESYTFACIGLQYEGRSLEIKIGFEDYTLLFQKAVAAWWIGLTKESRSILFDLPNHSLNDKYKRAVQNNMSKIGSNRDPFLEYTKDKSERLKFKFEGYEKIDRNYSQVYQDMFVLSMLNGKENGYYLEVGSDDPFKGSNTCLLEKTFNWKGISIEIKEPEVVKFKKYRNNPVICRDALSINYSVFLKGINAPSVIDYLQLDCEPPETTYNILLSIPFEEYKFAVITFEHDYYADSYRMYRELSRMFLRSHGYELVVGDIAPDEKSNFEDWWVHPDLIDNDILVRMKCYNGQINNAEKYLFSD
jgi:hypothetical protein